MLMNSPEVYKTLVDDHINRIQREAEIARLLQPQQQAAKEPRHSLRGFLSQLFARPNRRLGTGPA